MIKDLTLALVLTVMLTTKTHAQVSTYSFNQSIGTYGSQNTGTVIANYLLDDAVVNVNLPFTFNYNGNPYTSINVCDNGYLSFNSITGNVYIAISNTLTQNVLAPFSHDLFIGTVLEGDFTTGSNIVTNVASIVGISVGDSLIDLNSDFGGINPTVTAISGTSITLNVAAQTTSQANVLAFMNGTIRQLTSGAAPNRVCTFEYRNMTRYEVYNEVINFKIKLYETSGRIEFIYGPITPGLDNINPEVGIKGAPTNDYSSRYVNSGVSWLNSVNAPNQYAECDFSNVNFPPNGLVYAWQDFPCVTPTLTVTSSSVAICKGSNAVLTASGAESYSWSTVSTATQIVITPSATSTYTLIGYNETCTASITFNQPVVPIPTLTVLQSNAITCIGTTASFTANGATTYSWSNGTIGAQLTFVAPATNTTFVVTGSNSSCSRSLSVTQNVSACTGIRQNNDDAGDVIVYPNPSAGNFRVKINSSESNYSLKIYNVLGANVHSQTVSGGNEIIITTTLPEGVYYVELASNNTSYLKQLVVVK